MAGTPLTDLEKPLGQDRTRPAASSWSPQRWARPVAVTVAASVGAIIAGLALLVAVHRDPDGGEPIATAQIIERERPAPAPATALPVGSPAGPRNQSSARQMEGESGVTVVRPGSDAPGAIVITIPDSEAPVTLAPAPDPRLTERSRYGLLPRIGADGATPAQVYARPFVPPPGAKAAGHIALIVGGLGISQSGTAEAIAKLPPAISLAFAPYGSELERTVQKARGSGHEIFLQVPMEPFDYPDNDPGPHTLLTGPKMAENGDKLQWALGRFTGYVGVVNFLGGRLTADAGALAPVLKEFAGRGLMVVDDGSSARSLLASAAQRAQIPNIKVDRLIDGVTRADAIDKELAGLEAMARERGVAVAAATALPVSIERIAHWAAGLEAKNLVLVPVSAAPRLRSPGTTGSVK